MQFSLKRCVCVESYCPTAPSLKLSCTEIMFQLHMQGKKNPQWLVPLWVFDLLCDEVEGVPARIGIQSRMESLSHTTGVQLGSFKRIFKVLIKTCNNNMFTGLCTPSFFIFKRLFS